MFAGTGNINGEKNYKENKQKLRVTKKKLKLKAKKKTVLSLLVNIWLHAVMEE